MRSLNCSLLICNQMSAMAAVEALQENACVAAASAGHDKAEADVK